MFEQRKFKKMSKINKIILLVGLMGSGKTSVGKRLARRLSLPFIDGDQEIEKAAGLSLVDVLKCFGEKEYRAGEERVMKRLLQGTPCVLASGGGSFVAAQTRELAKEHAVTLFTVKHKLQEYITEEYPYYSEADIVVETRDEKVENTVKRVASAVHHFFQQQRKTIKKED